MPAIKNARDHSRTSSGKTYNLVRKHTKPPADEHGWIWLTADFLESIAYRSLSVNALRTLNRILLEHCAHGALSNGRLTVTHEDLIAYGVSGELVADAIDELHFKGIVKVRRGRAGSGTAHPNRYRLTFTGDFEGAPATNEWKHCTPETAKLWSSKMRHELAAKRAKTGRKKNSSLRESEIRPLRESEMRRA